MNMANYSQPATNRFGLDIFAMTPSALPAPFGIESLHDWSPARYARSVQQSTGITSPTLTPHSPYSQYGTSQ
ncbi:hypothetical protein FRC12_019202 [Ceratobasidium sp. 428]|nr:hypothetical protein FRC12_019202 [Ceratobasidium sp. 428]